MVAAYDAAPLAELQRFADTLLLRRHEEPRVYAHYAAYAIGRQSFRAAYEKMRRYFHTLFYYFHMLRHAYSDSCFDA